MANKIGSGICPRCASSQYFDDHAVPDVTPHLSVLRCAACGFYQNRVNLKNWEWKVTAPPEDTDDGDLTTEDPIEVRLYARDPLTLDLLRDVEHIAGQLGATGDEELHTTRNGHAYIGVSLEHMRQAIEIDRLKSRPAA